MIHRVVDVLWLGEGELPETRELVAAGLSVDRVASLPLALERLLAGGAGLVVVSGALVEGREPEAFPALRRAGAGAVIALYSTDAAWRAGRAVAEGADAALTTPTPPGAVEALARRLIAVPQPVAVAAPERGDPEELADEPPDGGTWSTPRFGLPREEGQLETLVGDVALVHRSIEDLDRLLEQVLRVFVRRSGATRCSIMLLDRGRQVLQVRKATGLPASAADVRSEPVPLREGLAGSVAATGEPLLASDVEEVRRTRGIALPEPRAAGYRTRSCLLLPLRAAEGVIGVLCLADKRSGAAFDEADLRRLGFLSDQAAQAIENALKYRHMQDLAAIDELTGLANRRQFQVALEREVQRARRYDRQFTLAILDIDFFKEYNDRFGHQAGDAALAAVGEILRGALREVDVVARYGGEEFAVILPETAPRGGPGVHVPFPFLERLRTQVEEARFPGTDSLPHGRLTLSGGVASFPDDADNLDDLVREADRSLYVSKARGRNVITYRGRSLSE